jgi:diguanylate cyclase (GGDEF)-like protein
VSGNHREDPRVRPGNGHERRSPAHTDGPERRSAGLMVLAACGFLALSLVYMESALIPGVTGRVVADLAFLIPLVLSTVLCLVANRRSQGIEARFWIIGAALNAVLLIVELYWVWWIWQTNGVPPPAIYAPFQVFHAIAAVLGIALLAALVRMADAPAPLRTRWWLDLSALAIVTYVAALKLYVDPALTGVALGLSSHLIAAVYATWGAMMIAGALWVLVRPGMMRWRLWERLVAASIVIYSAGMVLWPVWLGAFPEGAPVQERSVFDLVLVLGHFMFVMAATTRLLNADRAWPMRKLGPERTVAGRAATYAAVGVSVLALPALVALAVVASPGSSDRVVYIVAAMAISVLAVGRMILSAVENGRLFKTSVSDPLTGLRNHSYFHERLTAEIEAARRFEEPLAVLWLDIDEFGRFNRLAGHAAGDEVLQSVASALRPAPAGEGGVYRVGGDEFAIIALGDDAKDPSALIARVDEALRSSVKEGATAPTMSGGLAVHPEDGDDSVSLADAAQRMSEWARRRRKGSVVRYDRDLARDTISEGDIAELEERTHLGTVRALAVAVDARLEASGTRSAAVAGLSGALARQLGLDDERVRLIETAALVHDVGMVALGDGILGKSEPLTPAEIEEVRRHPALGEQIVGASAPAAIVPWIRHHHERWDGGGYPDGLRAIAIPLEARIISVCDAWDAMTSERPYRRAKTPAEAVAELRACAGSQFDPELVEPLVRLVEAFHKL